MAKTKRVFITGATGFIGANLANELAEKGQEVHVVVRNIAAAERLMTHPAIKIFKGDLLDRASLDAAMDGCQEAYHLAGYVKVWNRRPEVFDEINVGGTINVAEVSKSAGVKKMVFCSTAGVMGPSKNGSVVHETSERTMPPITEYEKSKERAEISLLPYMEKGMEIVTVNPTRVFGPGVMSDSNAVTMLIDRYAKGKWRFLPGDGNQLSNYVYVDDVVSGIRLAMEKGKSGERYLLGGDNITYIDFFNLIGEITGKVRRLYAVPTSVILFLANLQMAKAKLFNSEPRITPKFARKYMYHWNVSSDKAKEELGYRPMELEDAIRKTWDWINNNTNNEK